MRWDSKEKQSQITKIALGFGGGDRPKIRKNIVKKHLKKATHINMIIFHSVVSCNAVQISYKFHSLRWDSGGRNSSKTL